MHGWLVGKKIKNECLKKKNGCISKLHEGFLYNNILGKFQDDCIIDKDAFFLEGYITNKQSLIEKYKTDTWGEAYRKIIRNREFPAELRGSFCGCCFDKNEIIFFTDHIGSKAIYYYIDNDSLIISNRLHWIVEIFNENNMPYHFDEKAARYMLTYGYMLDDTTFIKEIKRVLPGEKIRLSGKRLLKDNYYMPSINKCMEMTESEAIELIDKSFREAVKREFEKDIEGGYEHLVDLSGGLDSRMVSWVAHDLGYVNQTNFSYSKADYLDYKIASQIAKKLKHGFYFRQLDDLRWFYSVEEELKLNGGAALCSAITGGKDMLSTFNNDKYGIEHTGMIGDVIISAFASTEKKAYAFPQYGSLQYSNKLQYEFDEEYLRNFENQEIFDLYTRGFLGAMATYSIRQEYFEVSSPFLDVDFLDACFSVPFRYRVNHSIYLKWIKQKYPKAADFGWEKWAGVKPKEELKYYRNFIYALRKIKRMVRGLFGQEISDNMNPMDYWYKRDPEAQKYYQMYYKENINNRAMSDNLKKDLVDLFEKGNVTEKSQVITVLGMLKLYFGDLSVEEG